MEPEVNPRPFRCLLCDRVLRLASMLTMADIGWLWDNRIALGPLVTEPPPQAPGPEAADA